MTDNKNTILAIVLSALVLIAWQFFVGMPQQKARQAGRSSSSSRAQQQQQPAPRRRPERAERRPRRAHAERAPQVPGQTAAAGRAAGDPRRRRWRKSAAHPDRRPPACSGSIALKGARIDDLSLNKYHETVDKTSPPIVLLSPSGSPDPFYAEFGWTGAADTQREAAERRHRLEAGRLRRRSASATR